MQDVHRTGVGSGSGGMNFLDREVGRAGEGRESASTLLDKNPLN